MTLNDGNTLPAVRFGTYQLRGDDGADAVLIAIEAGYRLLDTALNYQNEADVGKAIRRSGLPRESLCRLRGSVPHSLAAYPGR